jgi:hypothetical protein
MWVYRQPQNERQIMTNLKSQFQFSFDNICLIVAVIVTIVVVMCGVGMRGGGMMCAVTK